MYTFSLLKAQTPPPLDFFPHHQGDVFEYQYSGSTTWFQNIITKDSLGAAGIYYLETSYFGQLSVDTLNLEVRGVGGGTQYGNLLFKLDADSGQNWIAYRYENGGGAMRAEVVDVFPTIILGHQVVVKQINYSDSASGLIVQAYRLSSVFGIIAEYEDLGLDYYLRGARINGVIFGTVTSVKDLEYQPTNFVLYQNYPNPFNPATQIEYEIIARTHVKIEVFDAIGKRITTLADEYYEPGIYHIRFDGSTLTSGVYYCRMYSGAKTVTKPLILLK